MSEPVADVLIVGAGVIGLGLADTLARRDVSVMILERERAGARASWAGAGMLNCRPHIKSKPNITDYGDLALASIKLYEQWAAQLLEETEIDIGFRRCGSLEIFTFARMAADGADAIATLIEGCGARGVRAERITPEQAKELEPALDVGSVAAAAHLSDDAQIRPPRLVRALALSCRQREAKLKEGVNVADIWIEHGQAVGVIGADGQRYRGGKVVCCASAWTAQFKTLTQFAPGAAKIKPVRGQIVCYKLPTPLCSNLITCDERYVVSRPDGVTLVGSTTEKVGFEAVTTPEGQTMLRQFGGALLPALKAAEPVQGWADLRPGLNGRHPLIGPVPGINNLFVTAGHYRNGICLAPITAEIMAALLFNEKPPLPIADYYPRARTA
ncbi:MAG: FAD-dependent oxidoreductase [Planctomycetota bacterium]